MNYEKVNLFCTEHHVASMKKHGKKSWLRFLALICGITFCFLLVAALVTAYIVSHPELGLAEGNPSIHAVISEYGLMGEEEEGW